MYKFVTRRRGHPENKQSSSFRGTTANLVHVIVVGRLETASRKTEAIKVLNVSRNVIDLKSFLSFYNVIRKLVPIFARIALLPNVRFQKEEPFNFELNEEELKAMKSLLEKVISPPLLASPSDALPVTLETDACDVEVRCVFLLEPPETSMTGSWDWSPSVICAKRIYCKTLRGCLSIA